MNSAFLKPARLLLVALCCLLALPAQAENGLPTASSSVASMLQQGEFLPVEQAYQLEPEITDNGLQLNWTIAPGYYLYQHRFKFFDNGTPLEIIPDYPPGTSKYDDYYEKELQVYYQALSFQIPLAGLGTGLTVESQACADAGLCYPPRQQHIAISGTTASLAPQQPAADPGLNTSTTELAIILLMAIAGGAFLNLMPCVFPVLSIKALSLTQTSLSKHSKHLHGLAYTLGVVVTFVAVAALLVALRATGGAVGWGFQLQSPVFVAGLAYLFVLMGLSFSGLFTIGERWISFGQSRNSGHSLESSFLTGALATIVASPCTAPLMGTALGFALTQPTAIALLIFVFLGLGMALPLLILSWWPNLIEKLPQPGPWMERFRQFLAFPLYLSAIWLLWVLGHQTDVDTVATVLVSMTIIALGIWLSHGQTRFAGLKRLLVLSLVALAIYLPASHFLQLRTAGERAQLWQPYTAARLEKLIQNGEPVFVNLTADWCLTCLANEKMALSSERFYNTLSEQGIVYLKGDWTNYNPEVTALLNHNQRNGVPLYLLYKRNGKTVLLPQLLTESLVIEALKNSE